MQRLEEGLDAAAVARVPFGRNRFLRVLGTALTGVAVGLVTPRRAEAQILPDLCYGSTCSPNVCSGFSCYPGNLCAPAGEYCIGGSNCWFACDSNNYLHICCEWIYLPTGDVCHCSSRLGRHCPSPEEPSP